MGNRIGAASPEGRPEDIFSDAAFPQGSHEATSATLQIKVWSFEKGGITVASSPVSLDQEICPEDSKCYVILTIKHADFQGEEGCRTMEDLANRAKRTMTPRGLVVDVGSGVSGPYAFELYVWNGRAADIAVKAEALSTAFTLSKQLRERSFIVKKLFNATGVTLDGRGVSGANSVKGNKPKKDLTMS